MSSVPILRIAQAWLKRDAAHPTTTITVKAAQACALALYVGEQQAIINALRRENRALSGRLTALEGRSV